MPTAIYYHKRQFTGSRDDRNYIDDCTDLLRQNTDPQFKASDLRAIAILQTEDLDMAYALTQNDNPYALNESHLNWTERSGILLANHQKQRSSCICDVLAVEPEGRLNQTRFYAIASVGFVELNIPSIVSVATRLQSPNPDYRGMHIGEAWVNGFKRDAFAHTRMEEALQRAGQIAAQIAQGTYHL